MLEWYRAFTGMEATLHDTEQIVRRVATSVSGECALTGPSGARVVLDGPFERMTVREAFRRFAQVPDAVALAERDEASYFSLLVDHVEPGLAGIARPVFLTEYPASQAALARLAPHDETVAERFELFAGGVELCNGFGELTDPVEQRRRFRVERARRRRARARAHPIDEVFLAALEEGMPPSSGNALGIDRLLMLAMGAESVGATQAFSARRL